MKLYLKPVIALLAFSLLVMSSAQAGTKEKMVIALKSSDFELAETDISELAVGESRTIETGSGKVIDILRTQDGVELYVDGELVDMSFGEHGLHARHAQKTHVEIICDDDEACDDDVFILGGHGDFDVEILAGEDGEQIFIHKNLEFSCNDDDANSSCSDKTAWLSEHHDIELGEIHEQHVDGGPHKVIVIKKEISIED